MPKDVDAKALEERIKAEWAKDAERKKARQEKEAKEKRNKKK